MNDPNASNQSVYFLNTESSQLIFVGSDRYIQKLIIENYSGSRPKKVTVFSEYIPKEFRALIKNYPSIELISSWPKKEDISSNALVCCSSIDHDVEAQLVEWASERKFYLYIQGKPGLSDFSIGDHLETSQLTLGINLNDFDPEVQHRIRKIIRHSLPKDIDPFIERLKFAHKNPLMQISEELVELDRLTTDYIEAQKHSELRDSEFEHLSKVIKATRRRSNIYLGILGFIVVVGLFTYTLISFGLMPDIQNFLNQDNHIFYKMLAVGFVAEIVAGSMGMGYGVLCTTILLILNVPPPVVSASIHSAETFTSAAGSISHFKLKNVNLKLVKALAIPAIAGAIIGAIALTVFGEEYAHIVKPIISVYTLYLGINILRNAFKSEKKHKKRKSSSNLTGLGLVGGFIDSFAGGGWGPLVTGTLMKEGRTPRYVVGSSTVSKFILTITSAITFIITIGIQHWNIVLGLLIGGIITAPFSAMLTAKVPVKFMFRIIGTLVIVMSTISIVKAFL